jgi:hypothetical protein
MSKQVGNYSWMKIKENYHINDSKFSSRRYNFYFLWVKIKKINIIYHFPQYESWWIVLCHYDLCWFLVVYGFDKSTWTWSGKYWYSLFLLIKSKNYILLTELVKTFFFCLTLGQTGTGVLSYPWPLCLSHHFFVILYITMNRYG